MAQYVAALAPLLDELQNLSDRSDDEAKAARQSVWSRIAEVSGQSLPELATDLGRGLDVQPITIKRWISGEYAPRLAHLTHLRAHWGLVPKPEARLAGLTPVMDAPVPFDGGFVAIRTLNHLFYCLQRAAGMFFFKGVQAFRIGRSQQVREQVVNILRSNPELMMYYFFREESEAAQSLQGFYSRQYVKESGVIPQVRGVPMSVTDDLLGLGASPASPFVIRYGKAGIDEFKREIDIWYELPVEEVDAGNGVIDYRTAKSVFVQLPEEEALKAWGAWSRIVRELLERNDVPFDKTFFS